MLTAWCSDTTVTGAIYIPKIERERSQLCKLEETIAKMALHIAPCRHYKKVGHNGLMTLQVYELLASILPPYPSGLPIHTGAHTGQPGPPVCWTAKQLS